MLFGVSINDTFEAALDDVQWADSAGLDAVAVPDHVLRAQAVDASGSDDYPAPEPFVQLAAFAVATSHVRLLTLTSPVTFRHPAVLLKAAIELSHVSRGRFTLGLGAGYRQAEHERFGIPFPATNERYQLLEDALGYVRAGSSSPNPGFSGHRVRLAEQSISPEPLNLKLLVGGSGPERTPMLAGQLADEYNTFIGDPAAIGDRVAVARRAFADFGRSGELAISVAAPLIVGDSDAELHGEAARQAARRGLSSDDYLRQQRDSATALIGSVSQVAEQLQALCAVGVNRCYFVFDGPVDRGAVLAVREAVTQQSEQPAQHQSPREAAPS